MFYFVYITLSYRTLLAVVVLFSLSCRLFRNFCYVEFHLHGVEDDDLCDGEV